VKPAWGKNPFADLTATPDTTGGYEIFVTYDGKRGFPNELVGGVSRDGRDTGCMSIIMLRMYAHRPPPLP
jgi:hypothetical protein